MWKTYSSSRRLCYRPEEDMKPSHWRYYLLVVTMAEIGEVARLHREVDERSPWLEVSH